METRDFGWALRQLREDRRVYRTGWATEGLRLLMLQAESGDWYIYIEYPVGHARSPCGSRVPWQPTERDVMAVDWEVRE